MAEPIWKDYWMELGSTAVSSLAFSVLNDDTEETIYTGTAYTRPGESVPSVRVNDIVAAQFKRGITALGEEDIPFFSLYLGYGSTALGADFYADWSYDPDFDADTDDLNVPPENLLMPGQLVPCTMAAYGTINFHLYLETLALGEFNADFNADYKIYGEYEEDANITTATNFQTAWLDLRDYPAATSVVVNGRTYKIGGGCRQFVLYYVNAYGGWDTFVVKGNTQEADEVTHHNIDIEHDNSTTYARGRRNYVNELRHQYTFHTHWMGEDESSRMHHLLNSPCVYLHDVVNDIIRPVVLTNTTTEYKRGPKLYQYTFTADLARERTRR